MPGRPQADCILPAFGSFHALCPFVPCRIGMPMIPAAPSLKRRVLHAGSWTIGSHGVSQVLRLASNLVMTRLMVPEMFGVMAIAMTLIVGLALFSDIGLRLSIIQSTRGEEEAFLNTAWSVQILRGVLIAVTGMLISIGLLFAQKLGYIPPNNVYHEPILPYVLVALSASMLVSGFESTKVIVASRRLALGRLAFLEITQQLVGIAVMIGWALVARSIWALVAGAFVSNLYRVTLGYALFSGPNNKWYWEKAAYSEIIRMGKWIFLSSILGFVLNNGDRLLLGGLVSAEMLGVYSIAIMIVGAVETGARKVISNVCYSAINEVVREKAGDASALRKIYYRFLQPVDFILYLITGMLYVSGTAIIRFLYDARYQDAGWILPILSFSLLAIRFDLASCCYLAIGRPKLGTALVVARLLGYGLVPPAFAIWGLQGALWVLALNFMCVAPVIYYFNAMLGILDWKKELAVTPALILGAAAGWLISIILPLLRHVQH